MGTASLLRKGTRLTAEPRWSKINYLDLYALFVDTQGRQGVDYYADQGTARPHSSSSTGTASGAAFRAFGAHVVVDNGAGQVVEVPLYEKNGTRYWTAIALVDLTHPVGASVRQLELYSAYGSERRPVLHPDGRVEMDAGIVEFKNASRWQQRMADFLNRQNGRR